MSDDKFEFAGGKYESIAVDLSNGCSGCGMLMNTNGIKSCAANMLPAGRIPNCDPDYRSDKRNVIFVERTK